MRLGRRFRATSSTLPAKRKRNAGRFQLEPLEARLLMAADTHASATASAPPSLSAAVGGPNIVIINTDDQQFDTLRFMPRTTAELVNSGTTFANSFATAAVCGPSRANLLTGQYSHNNGVLWNEPPMGGFENFNDTSTLATWLQGAGYRTGMVGKYMNSYDKFATANADPQNTYVPPGWSDWQAFVGASYYNFTLSNNGASEFHAGYSTDILAQKSVSFLNASEANDAQPFFLYFTPHAPHTPSNPAQRDLNTFANVPDHRPPNYNEADVSDKPNWVKRLPLATAQQQADLDLFRQRQLEALQSVDDAVGNIMDALRANGELTNTVVIFTSDNGQMWGEHRFDKKDVPYEEAIRTPLVIRDGRDPVQQTA